MAETSSCYALTCGEIVAGTIEKCPRCGGRMRTSLATRRLGWVMVLAGLFITGLMGTITMNLLPSLVPVHGIPTTARFNGTPEQARLILQLFFLLIGFGFAAVLNGIVQVATGQRSRIALLLSLGLAALIVIAAYETVRSI